MVDRPVELLELGEPGHHRRAVERDEPGLVVEGQLGGAVGEPEHDLWVRDGERGVEVIEDPDRVVPTDRHEDRPDLGIGERGVEVVGAEAWVRTQLGRRQPRAPQLLDPEAVHPLERVETALVDAREDTRSTPRRRYDRDPVAQSEAWWLDGLHAGIVAIGPARSRPVPRSVSRPRLARPIDAGRRLGRRHGAGRAVGAAACADGSPPGSPRPARRRR